jgi:hypothetical protein
MDQEKSGKPVYSQFFRQNCAALSHMTESDLQRFIHFYDQSWFGMNKKLQLSKVIVNGIEVHWGQFFKTHVGANFSRRRENP